MKKKAKLKIFPNTVYVYRYNEGTRDEYLVVSERMEDATEDLAAWETRFVGVYGLKETMEIETEIRTHQVKE